MAAVVEREAIHLNRRAFLIAESDLNDARVVRSRESHGYGIDAQWSDDFHHSVHVLLTGEAQGYYRDFFDEEGAEPLQFLYKALTESFVYSGQYAPTRGRRHGNSAREIAAHRFVVCLQNHDQVGNRMNGERLSALTSWPRLKLAAGLLLLSPYLPLLFMGEEYGESAPFLYFADHSDPGLVEAVRQGRKREFSEFMLRGEPPDPYAQATFQRSKLNHALAKKGKHRQLRELYRTLIEFRKQVPALELLSRDHMIVYGYEEEQVLLLRRWHGASHVLAIFNFSRQSAVLQLPVPAGCWDKLTDSDLGKSKFARQIDSQGKIDVMAPAESFALYAREEI
jgi:maltooligosyltrehalose trehalohydrolase